MAHDKNSGKPKGYCFIEFEHERDMHCKYIMLIYFRDLYKRFTQDVFLGSNWDFLNVSFNWVGKAYP